MKNRISGFILVMLLSTNAIAVEVAPRISDREIIEKLTELKAGQVALDAKIDKVHVELKGDIKAIQQQIADLKDSTNKQFEQMFTFLWILSGIFTALVIAVIGFANPTTGGTEG